MNFIIKNNEKIEIKSVDIIDSEYKKHKFKTLKINNDFILKGIDKFVFCCISCNKEKEEQFSFKEKFFNQRFICKTCLTKETNVKKYGSENGASCIKNSILKKYGVENVSQLDFVKEKVKQTNLQKYGKTCNLQIEEVRNKMFVDGKYNNNREKCFQTNLERYGTKNTFQILKSTETKLKKYGNKYYNNRNKINNTNIQKYGSKSCFSSKEIREKINKKLFNKVIIKLSQYVSFLSTEEEYLNKEKYSNLKWKCKTCNTEFEDYYANGKIPRCPTCFPKLSGYSNMEKEVADWIKSLNVQIDENNRKIISPLELDIYIPSHNLAIEFDGLYWHSELNGVNKDYHLNKTNKCLEKGIHLLHIFEDEWINKQDIVKSIIKNNLGLYDTIIYGRNCVVKDISSKEASEFYDINHIQGSCASSINLGLYYKDELVSCLSFAKPRFNKKYNWEITRFANKLNYKIHGSFGKLWKHKPVGSIITYSDKRLFIGSVYKKHMIQLPDSKPAYWYVKNGVRYNRVEFQKHKLQDKLESYDVNLTEWENMQLNGYDRIYDCGNWIFEFK